jgi:hypothetical protein
MKRSTPLKPSAFKRKPGGSFSSFHSATKELERKPMKKRARKKPTVAEGSKYLEACRGEACYLNVCCPWTDWADPTVVPCHSNFSKHGKAAARKADHEFSVPGCMTCHAWLDTGPAPYEEKLAKFESALDRWIMRRARKIGTSLLEAA